MQQALAPAGRPRTMQVERLAELVHRVREEAHAALAQRALLAQLRAVACGVQPALKHAVGVAARVAALAAALHSAWSSGKGGGSAKGVK